LKKLLLVPALLLTACSTPYVPRSDANSTDLTFELLTRSGSGGGVLSIGTGTECEAEARVSPFRLGHTFQSDLNIIKTRMATGVPVTFEAEAVDTVFYACRSSVSFVPKPGATYYMTYQYLLPGCALNVFENTPNGRTPIEAKKCR
jgi:hypothetical protein